MADPATVRLTAVYQRALLRLQMISAANAAALWAQLTSIDQGDEDLLVAQLLPYIEAAQVQAVHLTDAYLTRFVSFALGAAINPQSLTPGAHIGAAVRGGTPPDVVYRRPFGAVRKALADGVDFPGALGRGRAVITRAARTDVALSTRAASSVWMTNEKSVTGWQRVTSGTCCALCSDIASTDKVYRTEDLMPLHPACSCSTAPVMASDERNAPPQPAGSTVDDSAGLEAELHDGAPGDLVQVFDHGELGPVLYHAGDHFSAA